MNYVLQYVNGHADNKLTFFFFFFFFGGGGGGGGGMVGGGGDKDRVLKSKKKKLVYTENIGKLVGRRGKSQFISGELGNRLHVPAYCSKH